MKPIHWVFWGVVVCLAVCAVIAYVYLDATKQRQRAQREIADAEKRLADLRRKIGG